MIRSTQQTNDPQTTQEAATLLRRIGWQSSDWAQIEVYAAMPPARKVAQMLRLRHEQMKLLKSRLRQEHPGCSDADLVRLLQEHLALLSDNPAK